MQAQFAAVQTVSIPVPDAPISIKHYLRQPKRLMHSLVEPSQVQQISAECFRLKMRSRQFMMLTLQPIVDIQIWTDPEGILRLKSTHCELGGLDFVNQRFELQLEGELALNADRVLKGLADLRVSVDIPPMLMMTPKAIITAAGNSMLKSILASVKHRLAQHIIDDYLRWVESGTVQATLSEARNAQVMPRTL